jgi:transcriptional regulator with XRE-family HTH domain
MSTEKYAENKIILDRLISALLSLGLKKHGMGKKICEATGYSSGQVSNLLSEKDPLNDRFLKSVCQGFGINERWLRTGVGDRFLAAGPRPEFANEEIAKNRPISITRMKIEELFNEMEDKELEDRVLSMLLEFKFTHAKSRPGQDNNCS